MVPEGIVCVWGGELLFQPIGEAGKCAHPHFGKDGLLVLEIAVRCHGADPQSLGQFAHIEALKAQLGKKLCPHVAQAVAKFGDVGGCEVARHEYVLTA